MRSPGNRREMLENAWRGLALAALIALAVRLWVGASRADAAAVIGSASLDSALTSWTASAPAAARLNATSLPDVRQRDWLVALRRAGLEVDWVARDTSRVAVVAEAGLPPQSPTRIIALGLPASTIRLGDDLGAIDAASTSDDGVAAWRASAVGIVRAALGTAVALGQARDSLAARPVLVLGQAGWESKFVTAALEEDGWSVTSRITVAPGAVVRQGSSVALDTGSISVVVVLDSTSPIEARRLSRFVNDGGGVVASGAGVHHPALRTMLPRVSSTVPGELGALLGSSPRDGLQARRFAASANAIALERRGTQPIVVARRLGAGRVVGTGYDDTWRVRFVPPDEKAPQDHREWWSSLVAGVARPALISRDIGAVDESPFAATVDALGTPVTGDAEAPRAPMPWNNLLASLAALALLAEWLSRRLRGVA